jgi:alkylation response protein AidB-like acyl-CoA dehydrogenase
MIKHSPVAMVLAEMRMRIEAARFLVWNAAWLNDTHRDDPSDAYPFYHTSFWHTRTEQAKAFASDTAVWVSQKAIEMFGMYGLSKDFPVEKCLRDALMFLHACMHRNQLLMEIGHDF